MGTWLPLWLDGRRAEARQLGDQADWGDPLPRPSLAEVDAVCKTYKSTAGLGHDQPQGHFAASRRAASALHRSAHGVRGLVCQTLVLGTHDGPSTQTHQAGIAPSASRWPRFGSCPGCAGHWRRSGSTSTMQSTSGAARARHATALLGPARLLVAAAKGAATVGGLSACSTLAKFYEHVGHDHSVGGGQQNGLSSAAPGLLVRFLRRLALPRSRQVRHFSLSGPSVPSFQAAAGPRQLPNSCWQPSWEQCPSRLPSYRLWNVVDDISGHVAGSHRTGSSHHGRGSQAPGGRPPDARSSALQKEVQGPQSTAQTMLKQGLLRQLEATGHRRDRLGAQHRGGFAAGQKTASSASSRGRLAKTAKRSRRTSGSFERQGHTLATLTLTGSNAGVRWGSEVLGFTPTQLKSIRVDAAKGHLPTQPRTERGHNVAGTRPGSQEQRTSTLRTDTIDKLCWPGQQESGEGTAGPRHHAGGICRGAIARLSQPQ